MAKPRNTGPRNRFIADRRSGGSMSRILVIFLIIIIFQVTGAQGIKKKVITYIISFENTLFSIVYSFLFLLVNTLSKKLSGVPF